MTEQDLASYERINPLDSDGQSCDNDGDNILLDTQPMYSAGEGESYGSN